MPVTSPSPDAHTHGPADREDPLVLIVDDNEKNRKLARDLLRAAGFRTLEAGTGGEGIAIAREHLPDVILMDLQLPDMNGTDAVRSLRDGARTAQLPVLVLSAHRLESDSDWLLEAGFAGYIEKPIDVSGFADQVRRYCGGPRG
jgi:two-component system cell cycle response regulator DivK